MAEMSEHLKKSIKMTCIFLMIILPLLGKDLLEELSGPQVDPDEIP
jgi:hypothetical protein